MKGVLRATLLLGAGAAGVVGSAPVPAGAESCAGTPRAGTRAHARAETVVVLSWPHTTWEDATALRLPHLTAFLDRAAVGNLSVRTAASRTTLGRGYATLGAGARADAGALSGAAFNRNEAVDNSTAAETYRRRTGRSSDAAVLQVGVADVVRANEERLYGAVAGALGGALASAGLKTAALGNGDGPALSSASRLEAAEPPPVDPRTKSTTETVGVELGRGLALAVMDPLGTVACGSVSEGLLVEDPDWPYGVRLDVAEVLRRYDAVRDVAAAVVVEASDLARVERARPLALPGQAAAVDRRALRRADELLGGLLERVDLDRSLFVLMSPAASGEREELTLFAMAGPGVRPGMLTSPSTSRSGVVTLPDVAPTILDALGVEAPDDMSGRVIESTAVPPDLDALVLMNRQSVRREQMLTPLTVAWILLQALVYLMAGFHLRGREASPALAFLSLWLLATPAAMFLLRILPFQGWKTPVSLVVVGAVGLAVAGGAWALPRRWAPLRVLAVTAFMVVLLALDVVTGSWLGFNSPFGYSPIVAGRFSGFSNNGFSLFFASGILCATLVLVRVGNTRRAMTGVAAFFAGLVVVDGMPGWGADVGGVLAGVPALAVTWLLLSRRRVNWRLALWSLGVLVFAVVAFAAVDLARPAASRTHLGRLAEAILSGDLAPFALVVQRKLVTSWSILTSSVFVLVVPVALIALAVLSTQQPGLRAVYDRYPPLTQGLLGVLVTAVLGALLNDSGIAIAATMLGIVIPVLLYLRTAPWGGVPEPDVEPELTVAEGAG